MALLRERAIRRARKALEITLTHRCTLQRMTGGVRDDEGNTPTVEAGAAEYGVPCRLETIQRAVRDEGGVTLVSIPTLAVSATLAPSIGDEVSAVTDQLGGVLAAGPLRIERVLDDTAGLGAPLLPTYELSAARATR
jgi:hypothetical protein